MVPLRRSTRAIGQAIVPLLLACVPATFTPDLRPAPPKGPPMAPPRRSPRAIGQAIVPLLLACVPATFTPDLRPAVSDVSAADGRWRPLFVGRRAGHTAIHDPVGHRMIVFGGPS